MPLFSKYQTIGEFLRNPFRNKDNKVKSLDYDKRYDSYKSTHKILFKASCRLGDDYYIHLTLPSESSKDGIKYDVVLRFFTDNLITKATNMLTGYNVQFFSNSPAFMYKYAYIYNKAGYLIDMLYDKIDAQYINTPPKNNPDIKSYESTIYYSCRFLFDNKFTFLNKSSTVQNKEIPVERFFNSIKDFKTAKLERYLIDEQKKSNKFISGKDKILEKDIEDRDNKKKNHVNKTPHVSKIPKKVAGGKVVKRTASKSTYKKIN